MTGQCLENNPECSHNENGTCTVDFGDYPDSEYFMKGGVKFFCNSERSKEIPIVIKKQMIENEKDEDTMVERF